MKTDLLWDIHKEIGRKVATVSMKLDRLQVELCEDSAYETPDAEEIRSRILAAMRVIDKLCMDVNDLAFRIDEFEKKQ